MAGSADAAKNALESLFNKTKEVVQTAAGTAKEYANVAIGKIVPNSTAQSTTSNASESIGQTKLRETGGTSNATQGGAPLQ